jgi:hypothetical protein
MMVNNNSNNLSTTNIKMEPIRPPYNNMDSWRNFIHRLFFVLHLIYFNKKKPPSIVFFFCFSILFILNERWNPLNHVQKIFFVHKQYSLNLVRLFFFLCDF